MFRSSMLKCFMQKRRVGGMGGWMGGATLKGIGHLGQNVYTEGPHSDTIMNVSV